MSIPEGPESICDSDKQTFQNLAPRAVERRENASCRRFSTRTPSGSMSAI